MAVRPAGQVVVLLWLRNWHSPAPRASATVNRALSSPSWQSTSLGNDLSNARAESVVRPSTSVEGRGRRTRFLFPCGRNYGSPQVTSMKGIVNRTGIISTNLIFVILHTCKGDLRVYPLKVGVSTIKVSPDIGYYNIENRDKIAYNYRGN